ncbi:MAG: hypothetical protein LUE20_07730 [Oscillospiraceae bacterium]|nr:hypothetical protein [Oscillospiraceae bacterium]
MEQKQNKLTDEQLARAKRLYQQGMEIEEIAALIAQDEIEIEQETQKLEWQKNKSNVPWDEVKLAYETGFPIKKLAEKYTISESTIKSKAKLNGWSIDAATAVSKIAEARLAGLSTPEETVEKQQAAIDEAVDERVKIVERHRKEWADYTDYLYNAKEREDIQELRKAKLYGESLKIKQAGERTAWNMDAGNGLQGDIQISWQE